MKKIVLIIFTMSFLASPFVLAGDVDVRQVKTPSGTFVTLSSSEKRKVEQDLLVASLRIELNNNDTRKVQDDINKAMQKAIGIAKSEASIKISTGNYQVYSENMTSLPQPLGNVPIQSSLPLAGVPSPSLQSPLNNPTIPPRAIENIDQQIGNVWKGSQTIDLQSKDAKKLLEVVKKIQDSGFVMNGLSYSLSPELEETQKNELLVLALKKIKSKAELVSKTLDKSGYEIVDVNVDSSNNQQPPISMMGRAVGSEMMMGNTMTSPVAEPGETEVNLSVSARVLLKP